MLAGRTAQDAEGFSSRSETIATRPHILKSTFRGESDDGLWTRTEIELEGRGLNRPGHQ